MKIKELFLTAVGTCGAVLVKFFGGWNGSIATLMVFMAIDYVSGLLLAGVFKKSTKSESGALESRAGFKGLVRKAETLLIVALAVRLDMLTHQNFIAGGVVTAFVANEAISITENAAMMGVPLPGVLLRAIDVMKQKKEDEITE